MYRLHYHILLVGFLTLAGLIALDTGLSLNLVTLGTMLAFVTQMALLIYYAREDVTLYSEKQLFFTTLIYGILLGGVFMLISLYYTGDTSMFSNKDALAYYKESRRVTDLGFLENVKRLCARSESSDWGMFVFGSAMMSIIPSKLFLNFVYMVTGATSAVMLFRIGKRFMPDLYAFEAALAYGSSSFLIFFHCTFLKESIFVFLVICAVYFFYKAVAGGNPWGYLWTVGCLCLILFFRPAISALLALAFLTYLAVSLRGRAVSVFFYALMLLLIPFAWSTMQDLVFGYTHGNMDYIIEHGRAYQYSTRFSWFVSWFAAPFGPFPSLFPREAGHPITINFYGAGLTYRLFLAIPLWMGMWFALKNREVRMLPLAVFVVLGMLATGYVLASLELRKVMTHIPFTYILAFYGLYQWQKKEKRLIKEPVFHLFAIGVLVLWTLVRG